MKINFKTKKTFFFLKGYQIHELADALYCPISSTLVLQTNQKSECTTIKTAIQCLQNIQRFDINLLEEL